MTIRSAMDSVGFWKYVSDRARERDIERQLLYNRVRKSVVDFSRTSRASIRTPPLLREFLKTLLASAIGFWIIVSLLAYFFHATPVYTLIAFGLFFSLQATYHKYKLSVDPAYKIPRCGCGGARNDATETVLRSRESAILKVPNSAIGAALYAALLVLIAAGYASAATLMAVLAVMVSVYLAYVMVARIAALCSNCINIFALNLLIVWQLLR